MMSFCRKSVHSFWSLTSTFNMDTTTNTITSNDHHHIHHENNKFIPPWKLSKTTGGLGTLVTSKEDNMITQRRLPNVLESTSSIKSPSSSSSSSPPKKDPNRVIGFIDDMGGGVNGLMSCTESLGFESSDERRVENDDNIDNVVAADDELTLTVKPWSTTKAKCQGRRRTDHHEVKKFPPPISSLNQNGQPSFFLRPVRKDGRLELTEVRIHRPEILKAYREDGRLRLHLIRDDDDDDDEEKQQQQQQDDIEEEEEDIITEEEEGDEIINRDDREMKFSMNGGEGFLRCHERLKHHHRHYHHQQHQHHLHMWRQQCVTTR